jgi:SPP1 gp7 family putative phage head morphogenesis protein
MRPACKTVTPLPVDPFAAYTCACHGVDGIAVKGRDPKEIAQWKTLIAKRRATVAGFKSAFTRVLMGARAETLKAIAERHLDPSLKSAAPVRKNVAADFEFSLSGFAAAVRDALAKQQKNALQTAGTQLLAELDKDDPWSMPPAEVTQYLAARENRLRDVPQNVFDRIKASLSAGLDAGDTTAELTSRVKAEFNTIADGEARRIAMTETAAAYGAGRDSAMKSAGVQFKQWLTSGNDNVRPYHAEANGQTVQIDEPFIVGGEELMHPGDDTGSAGNVINCHCISIAVAGPEANAAAFKSPAVQPITINLPATPPPAAVEPVQVSITLNQPGQPQRRVRHVRDAAGRITESITEDVPATGAAQP